MVSIFFLKKYIFFRANSKTNGEHVFLFFPCSIYVKDFLPKIGIFEFFTLLPFWQ